MTSRRPLVALNGGAAEIPAGDTLPFASLGGAPLHALNQGRLTYVSSTQVALMPASGNLIFLGGATPTFVTIPAGGVSLSNTGLTAGTFYFVYAYLSGATLTLEASTTGHAQDATYGHEIKSGDPTRTHVGIVYMDAGSPGTFAEAGAKRYVRSWFNRLSRSVQGSVASVSSSSTSAVELSTAARVQFVVYPDDIVDLTIDGWVNNNTAGQYCATRITIDGSQVGLGSLATSAASSAFINAATRPPTTLSEGLHTATQYGLVSGGTGTWNTAIFGRIG